MSGYARYAQMERHIAAAEAAIADREGVIAVQTRQMEETIVAAQAALVDRDVVIAAQTIQVGMLSQRLAAVTLRDEAAVAGPARSAALRGAAAMASSGVGGATLSSAAAAEAAASATHAASAARAASVVGAAAAASANAAASLPMLSASTDRCRQLGCVDHPVGITVFMTKAGKKWHATRTCTAVRGRETTEFKAPL